MQKQFVNLVVDLFSVELGQVLTVLPRKWRTKDFVSLVFTVECHRKSVHKQ